MKRNIRAVTVCVEGFPADYQQDNDTRLRFCEEVFESIDIKWKNVDFIVLPGAFFIINRFIGDQDENTRRRILNDSKFVKCLSETLHILKRSKSAHVIVGVDGSKKLKKGGKTYEYDQLSVCINREIGVCGVGRKIFPTKWESKIERLKEDAKNYISYVSDFESKDRIVLLPNEHRLFLCSCYDMFGIVDIFSGSSIRKDNIHNLGVRDKIVHRRNRMEFFPILESSLLNLKNLLTQEEIDIGVCNIHHFASSATSFWQRHGIASCSAAFGGAGVGAAHFNALPSGKNKSVLAAHQVSWSHIFDGTSRKSNSWYPSGSISVKTNNGNALVRLFSDE